MGEGQGEGQGEGRQNRGAGDHVDVLIVGAGISGIAMACLLQERCPGRTYAIVEGRSRIGGTWDLFRYPGVRSDSDMYTLGYSFKPWASNKAIPDGESIRRYVEETAEEHDVLRHITFDTRVESASWSDAERKWTVTARDTLTGEEITRTCSWLQMCSGYYSYDHGYAPEFPGQADFRGEVVHPQQWPEGLDVRGRKIVVIGSGATAVTLVPALAEQGAGLVTMLQRTPTWIAAAPSHSPIAKVLRRVLPERAAYRTVRRISAFQSEMIYRRTRRSPAKVREFLLVQLRKELGDSFPIEPHFTPTYDPWDQRLCLAPDSDIFAAIRRGQVEVVTDTIDTFTPDGIALTSGKHLDADIIVTATGLELLVLGGVRIDLDGEPVDFAERVTYKGFMYSDVPNLGTVFGYINASWTLRAELICDYVCRLLNHLAATGTDRATPRLPATPMRLRPYVDDGEFNPGYMQRRLHLYPKQGDREPWIASQSIKLDRHLLAKAEVDDGVMEFASVSVLTPA